MSVNKLKGAVCDFESAQDRFRNWGAGDSEPACVFQRLLYLAYCGDTVTIPATPDKWDLYTDEPGVEEVVKVLHDTASHAVEAIRSTTFAERKELTNYLKGYCGSFMDSE